jgi:hypothetical protein
MSVIRTVAMQTQISKETTLLGTPVFGRKLTLRKETIKALYVRRNSVMAE